MAVQEIPLTWQEMFIGGDTPADAIEGGCTVFENWRIAEDGRSLRLFPGFKRKVLSALQDTTQWPLDNGKRIVLFDADTLGIEGLGIAWVDWGMADPQRRILALGLNPNLQARQFTDPRTGTAWDPGVNEFLILDPGDFTTLPVLNRMVPHEYPSLINAGRDTLALDSRSRGSVIRNGRPVPTGILAPPRKPALISRGSSVRTVDHLGGTALATQHPASLVETELVTPSGVGSSIDPTDPYRFTNLNDLPIYDNGGQAATNPAIKSALEHARIFVKGQIDPATDEADLAYRNGTISFDAEDKRIRIGVYWVPSDSQKQWALDKAPHRVLEPDTLGIAFGASTEVGGIQNVLPIRVHLPAGEWTIVDLPMAATPGIDTEVTLPYTAGSWGLRLLKRLPPSVFAEGLFYQFKLDKLEIIKIPDGFGKYTGKWRARTTITAPGEEPEVESDPSPASDELDLRDTPTDMAVLVQWGGGFYDTIDSGFLNDSANWFPENMYQGKLKYLTWLNNPEFGVDPKTGQPRYRLAGDANRDAL